MPLNRDDVINEVPVSGSSGITCNRIEIRADPITRDLYVSFALSRFTVLADNKYFEEPIQPIGVSLKDGTGALTFAIYNRRTGVPLAGSQTRTYDALTRDLMSLFFDTASKNPPQ